MIKLNGNKLEINHFPDKTLLLKQKPFNNCEIQWYYEGDEELFQVIAIAKHFKSHGCDVSLYMPYIPNARQDRVKSNIDIFTLKYFAELINNIGFKYVKVLDPHSTVSEALFNNLNVINPKMYINETIKNVMFIEQKSPLIFYPDEGSQKRYSSLINLPFAFGIKERDWNTGNIIGLNVVGNIEKDVPILIIDDICSKGGTFYHSAKKLKELGVGNIYLYITHCENTILDGELINSGLIKKIFTTNSIFTKQHELIEIIKL